MHSFVRRVLITTSGLSFCTRKSAILAIGMATSTETFCLGCGNGILHRVHDKRYSRLVMESLLKPKLTLMARHWSVSRDIRWLFCYLKSDWRSIFLHSRTSLVYALLQTLPLHAKGRGPDYWIVDIVWNVILWSSFVYLDAQFIFPECWIILVCSSVL